MYPVLFEFGNFYIPTWHFCFLLANFIAYFVFKYLTKTFYPKYLPHILKLYLWAYIGGISGGRLFSMYVEELSIHHFFDFDSLTFYGAFLGAMCFVWIKARFWNFPFTVFLDLMVPALFLGLAIGRIGCFLNGDDFGVPVPLTVGEETPWWAVVFPNHEEPIARYPIQLVESFGSFFIFSLLFWVLHSFQKIQKGVLGLSGIASYAILRFVLEYYRDDYRGWLVEDTLSSSQGISLILILSIFVYGLYTWFKKIFYQKFEGFT